MPREAAVLAGEHADRHELADVVQRHPVGGARARLDHDGVAFGTVGGAAECAAEAVDRDPGRGLDDAAGALGVEVKVKAAVGVPGVDVGEAPEGERSGELHALELGNESARGGLEHRLAAGSRDLERAAEALRVRRLGGGRAPNVAARSSASSRERRRRDATAETEGSGGALTYSPLKLQRMAPRPSSASSTRARLPSRATSALARNERSRPATSSSERAALRRESEWTLPSPSMRAVVPSEERTTWERVDSEVRWTSKRPKSPSITPIEDNRWGPPGYRRRSPAAPRRAGGRGGR